MKVLVTGAHGSLGRYVARHLGRQGHSVCGIGHGSWDQSEQRAFHVQSWHTVDVNLDALAAFADAPDVIIHCAGSASVSFSMAHPFEDYSRSVSSAAAVLEYIRLFSRHTSAVFPSSAAVYGHVEKLPIKESAPRSPISPYGANKALVEILCKSYADNYDISVAILRFFSLYGEGLKKQLLWDACTKAKNGTRTFFGTGHELRDWLHLEDAAKLVEVAIGRASKSIALVNGGCGVAVSVRDVVAKVFSEYGVPFEPSFSGQERPGDPLGYQADRTAADGWGWSPSVGLNEGVSRYVEWYKALG
jgi:UDP-glucose 4-epimerase